MRTREREIHKECGIKYKNSTNEHNTNKKVEIIMNNIEEREKNQNPKQI